MKTKDRGAKPARKAKTLVKTPLGQASPRARATSGKTNDLLALLGRPEGATLSALAAASSWQRHSVRGFLSGVVRKKLGLNLVAEGAGHDRIYRVVDRVQP